MPFFVILFSVILSLIEIGFCQVCRGRPFVGSSDGGLCFGQVLVGKEKIGFNLRPQIYVVFHCRGACIFIGVRRIVEYLFQIEVIVSAQKAGFSRYAVFLLFGQWFGGFGQRGEDDICPYYPFIYGRIFFIYGVIGRLRGITLYFIHLGAVARIGALVGVSSQHASPEPIGCARAPVEAVMSPRQNGVSAHQRAFDAGLGGQFCFREGGGLRHFQKFLFAGRYGDKREG